MNKRHIVIRWSLLALAVWIILNGSCRSEAEADKGPLYSPAEIDSLYPGAAEQYALLCAGCHGNKVMAFVDRDWENGYSATFLADRIREGDEKDGMPPFGAAMTEEEIAEMADYLRLSIQNLAQYEFEERPDIHQVFHSESLDYKLELVTDGLESPWGMAFLPDGGMLIADKNGKLYSLSPDGKKSNLKGVPEVLYDGQGGLMDLELHPEFEENHWVYMSYSAFMEKDGEDLATTAVARARLGDGELTELQVIFEAEPYLETRHHYGCRLEFDREGYLYFSVGDRGRRDENPQSLENHCGKIHRLYDDGSIPPDNPFVNTPGALPSIYSYGHRNPQGVVMHPESGEIWTHEHGPRGGDEINIIRPGLNYGWPVISYGINYDGTVFTPYTEKEGMEQPLHYWVPSIAPCGMEFITGDRYPGWEGNLLAGSLKYEYLHMCHMDGDQVLQEEMLMKNIGRVRDVKQSPDGYIYVAVEEPGVVYRIIPQGS